MPDLTIEWIQDLAGEWNDESQASTKFREILQNEQTSTEEIEAFLREALDNSGSPYNLALQDLVNNIGERLGFNVDYGLYQGVTGSIGYDGKWISTTGEEDIHLVVETKKSTAYQIDPGQVGGYIDELCSNEDVPREQIYGLYVVGDSDPSNVAQTILGSRYQNQVRVISAKQLFSLLEIQEDSGLRHEQIVDVLLPINTVDVGQLVDLIQDVIEFQFEREAEQSESTTTQPSTEGWHSQVGANAVQGTISRNEIEGDEDDLVAVFPSQKSGVEFLKENNAWGFVRINQNPKYVAFYISEDVGAIRYIAKVKEIVKADEASLARSLDDYTGNQAEFDRTKKVVVFEPESLYRLSNEIPLNNRVPYSLRYTDLGHLKTADTTDDIL